MRRPLMALQLVFLVCLFNLASATERNIVASLPGFNGALPFLLETGYVSVDEDNGAELFYYFIQSEADPRRDPVLLWLTGGDRCTVFSGLVSEIVGAGFSFSRDPKGYDVGDVSSSLQLKTFLAKWFSDHPDFLTNPFYIGGDSYAGKIVPYLVQKISEDIEAEIKPAINLKGYLVGNPVTGERVDSESRVPYAHGVGIISDQLYETIMEHCRGEVYSKPKNVICAQSLNRFNELLSDVFWPHILYKKCVYVSPGPNKESAKRMILIEEISGSKHPPPRPPMDCLYYVNYLSYFWANNNVTRDALRIKKGSKAEWVRCHDGDLPFSKDIKSSIKYHLSVTLKGYRSLVYSGDHDLVIPFLGTQAWVTSLNFSITDDWRAWHLDGQSAGFTIAYSNNLTFATVKGGGHTAPEFQPERCQAMFRRWIANRPL